MYYRYHNCGFYLGAKSRGDNNLINLNLIGMQ